MKVKAKLTFKDKENKMSVREKDTEFHVSNERGKHLIELGFVTEIKQPKKSK